jgi:ferrous iron transport protein B
MRFVLIGQPNCGKSTLFNQVAGYKAETGNFTGTTVHFAESKVRVAGEVVELVDLPGTYTLAGTNPAERETFNYLVSRPVDVIINVIDATHLTHGLSLTLELLELKRPTVIALNMMDEAVQLGLKIDGEKLQRFFDTPVLPLVASKGRGVRNLFVTAHDLGKTQKIPTRPRYSRDVEEALQNLVSHLDGINYSFDREALAIKLLEGDEGITTRVREASTPLLPIITNVQDRLQKARGQPPVWVISAERHGLAANIADSVEEQGERRSVWRDRLDDFLLHPFFGYVFLAIILLFLFEAIYGLGSIFEAPLLAVFTRLEEFLISRLGSGTLITEVLVGIVQGIAGGVGIVLPYLLPFLFGLGFLEDIGYLPRVAFLMDALMHRMGLHGKAVVPFILGYGCNVPAVMSTRMLEDRRDRFLAATLATLVPCAARLAVVFGLVAFYLGPGLALGIYLFNLFVIAITGRLISALLPEDTPGLILEIPVYRMPTIRSVVNKTWFRAKEFIVEAWPILIVGSVVLAFLNYFRVSPIFNILIRPITWMLGLPTQVGVPLIFGILRKELSLIMLRQALGAADFSSVLTPVQMITFTVFVVFYIPCLATLAVLKRELGTRDMLVIASLTVVIAFFAALVARVVGLLVILL